MQRFTLTYLLRSLACAVLLAPAGIVANAAELGDVSARSFIGQPLSADIELVALAPDEVNALQVRLARPDVFRGANITMNPALSSVRMSVVKRDQKQFLHVTTTRAIDADYVHLYVELSAAGRQDVRLATVWLQADPNPPPPPAPVVASVPAPGAMTSADAERIAAQARAERAAASPAVPAVPSQRDRSRPAPLPSLHESETGVPGALKAAASAVPPVRQTPTMAVRDLPSRIAEAMGTPRNAPAATPAPAPGSASTSTSASTPASGPAPVKPAAKRDAAAADSAVPLPVAQALLPLGPLPLPAGVKRPAAPAACAPSGISAKECKALDTHSLALSSKLVELEGKMKALQGAIKNSAATPAATATAAAAPAAATRVGQAGTAVLAAAGSSVAAAVAAPAAAKEAPKSASVASAAPGPGAAAGTGPEAASARAAEDKPGKSSKPGKAGEAQAATMDGASASASARVASASASASADGHGANASAAAAGASASASAPVPLKRVLPKLKYKKEKPVERPTNYLAWGAGAAGVLLLAGAGLIYWRRKKSGAAPLKIWQGFRKKKPAEAAGKPQDGQPLHEVTPESIMQ
jgi:pilus assembly protein FimV